MNKKEILILTGAGFGKDMGLPLENEIIRTGIEACKVLEPELIEKLNEEWKLIDSVHSFENYSFEQLLTKIMLEEQSIIRPYEERLKIFDIKLAILKILVNSLIKPLSKELHIQYVQFLNLYKDCAYFATLNYDYLIAENIPWHYGIDFDQVSPMGKNFYVKGEKRSFPNVFIYLKLHGSFNWHICPNCNTTRLTDLDCFGVSGELFSKSFFVQACTKCKSNNGQFDMQPLIVPPSLIKYYNSQIFLNLWFKFNQILKHVKKIIIIGCSIRDEDTVLISSLYNLVYKNPDLEEIVLINPDPEIQVKIKNYTKVNVRQIQSLENFLGMH
ncbi:MAG: hypothetical protein AB1480_15635 [Nitrospirota bacterium]